MNAFASKTKSIRHARVRPVAAFVLGMAILFATSATQGKSIFDDDYTPPKRADAAAQQPTPTPLSTRPAATVSTPVVLPPNASPKTPAKGIEATYRGVPDRASRGNAASSLRPLREGIERSVAGCRR